MRGGFCQTAALWLGLVLLFASFPSSSLGQTHYAYLAVMSLTNDPQKLKGHVFIALTSPRRGDVNTVACGPARRLDSHPRARFRVCT